MQAKKADFPFEGFAFHIKRFLLGMQNVLNSCLPNLSDQCQLKSYLIRKVNLTDGQFKTHSPHVVGEKSAWQWFITLVLGYCTTHLSILGLRQNDTAPHIFVEVFHALYRNTSVSFCITRDRITILKHFFKVSPGVHNKVPHPLEVSDIFLGSHCKPDKYILTCSE